MQTWWNVFLNIIYPPKCPACKTLVFEHGAWCPACLAEIVDVRGLNMEEHRLKHLDSCRVVCEYTAGVKLLIHDMKFRRQKKYAKHLKWLLKKNITASYFPDIDHVISVPLNADRLKERGYDQVEYIFKDWSKKQKLSWTPGVLTRSKQTVPQWKLDADQRKENIKDAFVITRPEIVANKNILLVDDIITTGITLDECAKALKQAGANSVHGLVVASGAR